MVKLYGITHSASINSLFFSMPINISPAPELLEDLAELPKSSKIGIEWIGETGWQEVQDDLMGRSFDAGLQEIPFFDDLVSNYWRIIINELQRHCLHPVFLENKDVWLKYNQAVVALAKERQNQLFHGGEDDRDYHEKLCRHNEARKKRVLVARRIHEIERDEVLLSAVSSGNLDAAIVGYGHADYWIANKQRIQQQTGIIFDSYSKQQQNGKGYPLTVFVRNAEPDKNIIYQRKSLERAIRLMEQGRIAEGTPDYIGTWCDYEPSQGYFEVFVRKRDGEDISGVIEDVLGSATFSGRVNKKGIQFTKNYTDASPEAIRGEIPYEAERTGQEFYGFFKVSGFRAPFYLIEADKKEPIEMGIRLFELFHPGRVPNTIFLSASE